jgi:hypothetical protein
MSQRILSATAHSAFTVADAAIDATRIFPNQFILGPAHVGGLPNWQMMGVGEDIKLTVHPGLRVTQVRDADRSLMLLGYILDPHNPGGSDEDVLRRLLEGFSSVRDLIALTASYGGRWLIVATQGSDAWLFTDALGLRQAFYTPQRHGGGIWGGSQPGTIAEILGLTIDDEAREFVNSYAFRSDPEYRWPATATPYKEVRHLLPNHYLDLKTGISHRYWPDRPLAPATVSDALDTLAERLPGLVEAAVARFDLVLGLTAGWDSRLVLAASRAVKDKIACVTVRQRTMSEGATDIATAERLAMRLGLGHQVIRAPVTTSAAFSYAFTRSVCFAHKHYAADAEAIFDFTRAGQVALTGSGAEVGRCSFRSQVPLSRWRHVTARDLARLQRMDALPFAVRHFERWLSELGDTHGISVLDLFEWEQGHGNWLAMTQLEFDSAWRDIFTPYNSREVLATLLSVDERYRRKPDYRLFRDLMIRLWPEVLTEPINPERRTRLPGRVRRRLGVMFERYRSIVSRDP